ncbi:MAG: CBS domain-containing protein [Magnetococcales bacterium]|nr:CBS domain-containing protein [Magnetococcales bacterium]
METPESIVEKARPFFLDYFQSLSEDLNLLATAPVECTFSDVTLMRGRDDVVPLFATDRSVAYAEEDSSGLGGLHLVFDVTTSIALAGMMMMTNEAVIQEKVSSRAYDEETHEGFREVSTQIITALNRRLEEKVAGGAHLFLDSSKYTDAGKLPPTLDMEATYLVASVEIQVAAFGNSMAYWLLSRKLAESILRTPIPGSKKEMAGADADVEEEEDEALPYTAPGELLAPQVVGSVRLVMTETPFTLKEEEKVMRGITAITQDGYRYIGIERKGVLIRVLSQSDIHQVMGPFYDSGTPTPRDKALHALPIGKLNAQQQLVKIASDGTINEAAELMQKHKLLALPVVSNRGTLRGFVPIHAVLDYFRRAGKK